jgi:hypothetical protein
MTISGTAIWRKLRAGDDGERRAGGVRAAMCGAACAALVCGVTPAAAQASGGAPETPTIPEIHIHLPKPPKPQETASFKLVVEGKATSELKSQLSGPTGPCLYEEDGTVNDTTTYLRGKGVIVQFDRYGGEVLIHRAGRETDSSLAVTVATERTATGGSHASPASPALPCSVPPFELAQNKDCGQTFDEQGAMFLSYDAPALTLSITSTTTLTGGSPDECGVDPQTGLPADFLKAWPVPPKLEFGHLSLASIYGHAHALAIPLLSSDIHVRQKQTRKVGSQGGIGGTLTETAFNEATVRLIREKG